MKSVLCIAGMHRSGTSLVASWLEGCGLNLFEKIPSNEGNTIGHFEDKELLKIHSDALRRLSKESKGWIVNKKIKPKFNKQEQDQIFNLLESRKRKNLLLWGWKEPRTSLFLNEWKKTIPELKVVLLWRNADLVIDSLLRRSALAKQDVMKISKQDALINWKIYNQCILNYYLDNRKDSILINIEHLLSNPSKFIVLIRDKFKIHLNYVDIDEYYRPNMISKSRISTHRISRVRKFFLGIYSLEKKIIKHSLILNESK